MTRRPLAPGDVIHGHAHGAFGRDHYHCTRIEAVGPDWIVARSAISRPVFAQGRTDLNLAIEARDRDHPDGTCPRTAAIVGRLCHADDAATYARVACQAAARRGETTWRLVFAEEVLETLAESDPARLRAELVQVAAVAVAWVAAIDRRASGAEGSAR